MSAELEQKLAQKTLEARTLQRLSSDINTTLQLDQIYHVVLTTMDELFGFRHSMILLLDDSGDALRLVASRGYDETANGSKVSLGTGLLGLVAKKRRMMRLGNMGQQRAYISTIRRQMEKEGRGAELGDAPSLPGLPNAQSQIGIPLMIKDRMVGVFAVESEEQRIFSDADETLITIVANQAAIAIHNALLYRAEEQRMAELAEAHERLKQLNETLEDRVRNRTNELERANRELRETQAQLLQSAKMAALGDLVAGVAHEINTPLGSIQANADIARRAALIISEGFTNAELAATSSLSPRLGRALRALEESTATTLTASDRIVAIVKSLRQFARLDEAERKKANVHECIESTLTLLQHKLKEGIEVIRDFGDLPPIDCYPNRLNQLFMNLSVNAIQAMEGGGTISITTRREGDEVVLYFADTGFGIPSQYQERIFDPGFTTKGVGVGTGLGLAISYRIIQDHHGSIAVASEPGQGTLFTIRLPMSLDAKPTNEPRHPRHESRPQRLS
jgi:signal transduction histidine kinase